MSCDILEQTDFAGTDQFLDLGAAKHKHNARSITEYKTLNGYTAANLGKEEVESVTPRQPNETPDTSQMPEMSSLYF